MLLTIDERGSNITRNSVFDCHLSTVGRQMAIKHYVSNFFLFNSVDSIHVSDCRLSGKSKLSHDQAIRFLFCNAHSLQKETQTVS